MDSVAELQRMSPNSSSVEEHIFALLGLLGLKSLDCQVYIILVRTKRGHASDIAKILHIGRMRVYNTMNRLRRMGLIRVTKLGDKPTTFVAKLPNEALVELANHLTSQLAEVRTFAGKLSLEFGRDQLQDQDPDLNELEDQNAVCRQLTGTGVAFEQLQAKLADVGWSTQRLLDVLNELVKAGRAQYYRATYQGVLQSHWRSTTG